VSSPADAVATFPGHGEMADRIRAGDWAATPLGPLDAWPHSLRTAVGICLGSRYPIIIFWGEQLVQVYNDAYRPMLGERKHPAALGQPAQDCWPEIWDVIGPMLDGVLATGEATYSADLMLPMNRFGFVEEAYFTFSYSAIRDESGAVGGVFCAVQETTETVLAARRLALLGDVAQAPGEEGGADEALGLALRVVEGSPDVPFARVHLHDPGGAPARLVAAIGGAGGGPWEDALVAAVASAGDGQTLEAAPDGPPVRVRGLPISAAAGAPTGVLVAGTSPRLALDAAYRRFLDLLAAGLGARLARAQTLQQERERAEALAQLDRAKTTFFNDVSHEFRTPLTLMLGPLEELLDSPALPSDLGEQLQLVHRNGLRLVKLVNSLLDFSRFEAGRAEPTFEPTDLAALTEQLAGSFRPAIERAGLRLDVDCPPLQAPVPVDRGMWEKIVLNLLSNAFKFTLDGEIRVRLRPSGERVELEVADTGVGIAADELPRVFERFRRARGPQARSHEGTGIGLALVEQLVQLHGGAITVASEPGRGTTFTVSLPAAGPAARPEGAVAALPTTAIGAEPFVQEALRWMPEAPDDGRPSADGRPAILVVDDNADMRAYLRRVLGDRWRVDVAADGLTALRRLREGDHDLLVADVMMPGMDGLELVRAVRGDQRTRELPVILLSARAGEDASLQGLQTGADDYLEKPFTAADLRGRVEARLSLSTGRRFRLAREQEARRRLEQLQYTVDAAIVHRGVNELLRGLLDRVVQALGTDRSAILLVDPASGALRIRAAHNLTPEVAATVSVPVGKGFAGTIAQRGEPWIVNDLKTIRPVSDYLAASSSAVGVPLRLGQRVVGVLHTSTVGPHEFTHGDAEVLQLAADRAAIALRDAELNDREHAIAATLQQALLPGALPKPPGLEVAALYRPATDDVRVGGDFYDLFAADEGGERWVFLVGDVAGKGPPAAALTALVRHTVRGAAFRGADPPAIAHEVHRAIRRDGRDAVEFVTAVIGELRMTGDTAAVQLVRAGHPHPLVHRARGGVEQLSPAGSLLGAPSEVVSQPAALRLGPGDVLLVVTDGVSESWDEWEDYRAVADRVLEANAGGSLERMLAELVEIAARERRRKPDDVAVLAVRVAPPGAPEDGEGPVAA
jgi:signal transduction histidine kinase/serine phosphatase RsbU (regulator of sigma subunit)/FixJ family two-component response regulator